MHIKRREGKKGYVTLPGSFGCQYRKLEIRSRQRVPVPLSRRVSVCPATLTRPFPRQPHDYRSWMQAPKTLRDRTVTVDALAAHKSNNIDHVFTLPSLRSHHYYVTGRRYIQRERVYVCTYRRASLS